MTTTLKNVTEQHRAWTADCNGFDAETLGRCDSHYTGSAVLYTFEQFRTLLAIEGWRSHISENLDYCPRHF